MRDSIWMRNIHGLFVAGSLGILAACPIKPVAAPGPDLERCSDPYDCTDPNGTGIYTAEDGSAGIGPGRMMILRFRGDQVNSEAPLVFDGVYAIPPTNPGGTTHWRSVTGTVYSASYANPREHIPPFLENLIPRSVTERSTLLPHPPRSSCPRAPGNVPALAHAVPTWILKAPLKDPAHSLIAVSGDELRNLILFIRFTRTGNPEESYALDFKGSPVLHPVTGDNCDRSISEYWMQWTPVVPGTTQLDTRSSATPYCLSGPPAKPDSVVFQQGFDIDRLTGIVSLPTDDGTTHVTLSCYLGAPATVFRWRYDYTNIDSRNAFYFKAAIQMKRASYCGDANHFTVAGTRIEISDTHPPQPIHLFAAPPPSPDQLEASWSEHGACCFNKAKARAPLLVDAFQPVCNGLEIPYCTSDTLTCPAQSGSPSLLPPQLLDLAPR
jgi:hypothetical protein